MSTYQELMARKRELDIQIEAARMQEFGYALKKVHELIELYEMTPQDVFGYQLQAQNPQGKRPVAAKYRNPVTGQTWTGRGKPPKWIAGVANRDEFLLS